jgi:6-pyruvoyltetrahydropterin/6-carboxytetrahydropterin synthase
MYTLSIMKEISAAHRLRNYDGPCARIHGHNWKIRIEVRSGNLDDTGIAIDFMDIEKLLWQVIGRYDHRNEKTAAARYFDAECTALGNR